MQVFSFVPKYTFGSNMYIMVNGGNAAVIDPSVEYETVSLSFDIKSLDIKYVILTHAHFDHMLAIDSWVDSTSAKVIVGKNEADSLDNSYLNCYRQFTGKDNGYAGKYTAVSNGDTLKLGDLTLNVVETPGHTAGSISIFIDDKIFVGDVLFADGAIGRTDLPGGSYTELMKSIGKILSYPPSTLIYSGHGRIHKVEEIRK
jgi:glyoxylase-like metal-dependent hydrolase (beta-lactamase superfamily II)